MSEHTFSIAIGDWSNDGHGRCEHYWFKSNKPIEQVREAYFAAKKRLPKLCPDQFCDEYEQSEVPDSVYNALVEAGAPSLPDDGMCANPDWMASVVAWYLRQGDPTLTIESIKHPPMLQFYGTDAKGRHIDGFGYGLV
jgi:hypothetical protein